MLAVFTAPVGHRQPRAADLPSGVLRDEGMARTRNPAMPPQRSQPKGQTSDPSSGSPGDYLWPPGEDLQLCRGC
jgi:hypothetical protein